MHTTNRQSIRLSNNSVSNKKREGIEEVKHLRKRLKEIE